MSGRRLAGIGALVLCGCASQSLSDLAEPPAISEPHARPAPPAFETTVLPSGMTVLASARPQAPILTVAVAVRAPMSIESVEQAGLRMAMAAAMIHHTRDLDRTQMLSAYDDLGAAVQARINEAGLIFSLDVLPDQGARALDLLATILTRPAFDTAGLDWARDRMRNAFDHDALDPTHRADRVLKQALFGPQGRASLAVCGSAAAMQRVSATDLAALHAQVVHPANVTVVIAGPTGMTETLALVRHRLGDWTVPPALVSLPPVSLPPVPPRPPRTPAIYIVPDTTSRQVYIALGGPGVSAADPLHTCLAVELAVARSAVHRRLRTQDGVAYEAYADEPWGREESVWSISAHVEAKAMAMAVDAMIEILLQPSSASGPVSARNQVDFLESLREPLYATSNSVHSVARFALAGLPWDYLDRESTRAPSTLDDQRCGRMLGDFQIVLVGNPGFIRAELRRTRVAHWPVLVTPASADP